MYVPSGLRVKVISCHPHLRRRRNKIQDRNAIEFKNKSEDTVRKIRTSRTAVLIHRWHSERQKTV